MKIAVLGSLESWYVRDVRRAAEGAHDVVPITFRQLVSGIESDGISGASQGCDLRAMDCILVRTMPPGSLEQVVFRMDVLGALQNAGVSVINPARAIETAVDKYLTTVKLQQAGLKVPRTHCCQTTDEAMTAFVALGGDVVIKPLFGGEGRGLMRVDDESMALRSFKTLEQLNAVMYVQEFIPHHGYDLRLLVVGRRVFAVRRVSRNGDWRTNISRGASPEPIEMTADLVETAFRAAEAVGAPLAGVDLLPGQDGSVYTIEVNAVPGWRALGAALNTDIASVVLEFISRN